MNKTINTQELEPHNANTELEKTPAHSADSICLIPSQYFFIEFIPFENEEHQPISNKEAYRFFELQLESLSPLPLDQLLWGYYTPPNATQSILYASLKSRLKSEGYDSLEDYTWVLPEFIPQLALQTLQPSDLNDLTKRETDSETDSETETETDSETETETDSKNPSLYLEKDLQVSITQTRNDEEPPEETTEPTTSISLTTQVLWSADIRSETFKDQEQKNRSRLAFVNKSIKLSLYFTAFIILSELLLAGANLWLTQYASKIDTQVPTVRRIEDQHTLINKLDQISQNELQPIALLEQANQIRSKISSNIIYDTVDITNENEVTIKGTAGSVNDLNRYVSQLNQSIYFKVLEDPKYITRGGKTTFTLKMYFQPKASQR